MGKTIVHMYLQMKKKLWMKVIETNLGTKEIALILLLQLILQVQKFDKINQKGVIA